MSEPHDADIQQRYFRLSFGDYLRASEKLWGSDAQAGRPPTPLEVATIGEGDACMWTPDLSAQDRIKAILVGLGIRFVESSQQQVKTHIDGLL